MIDGGNWVGHEISPLPSSAWDIYLREMARTKALRCPQLHEQAWIRIKIVMHSILGVSLVSSCHVTPVLEYICVCAFPILEPSQESSLSTEMSLATHRDGPGDRVFEMGYMYF